MIGRLLFLISHVIGSVKDFYQIKRSMTPFVQQAPEDAQPYVSDNRFRFMMYRNAARYLARAYAGLCDRPMSTSSVKLVDDLSAFTRCYDDLMDNHGISHSRVMELLNNIDIAEPFIELPAARYYYSNIMTQHPRPEQFSKFVDKGGKAQDLGIDASADTPPEVLFESMAGKGGYFVLAPLTAVGHIDEMDEHIIYEMGGLMQFYNDVLDVRKDTINKEISYTISGLDMESVRDRYSDYTQKVQQIIRDARYGRQPSEQFWMRINILIHTGRMALDQYIGAATQYSSFDVLKMKRQEVVIDMDKPSNMFKLLRFVLSDRLN